MFFALVIFSIISVFAAVEYFWPRQTYTDAPYWKLRGVASVVAYLIIAPSAAILWDGFLADHRLFDARSLPVWQQVALGIFMAQLLRYFWHRIMHSHDFLWRHMHQMHHSAERVDVWGAFYFSPQDMVGFTLVASLAIVGIIGLGAEAAALYGLITIFFVVWQHANIRTPHWLGYFIVRPEAHALHHERGVHKSNYCDLPFIDMIFGTFRNPRTPPREAGFYDGASIEVGKMLMGVDIAASHDVTATITPEEGAKRKAA